MLTHVTATARAVPLHPVAPAPPRGGADPAGLAGLGACVDDALRAARVRADGPPDPVRFAPLRTRLAAARAALPTAYRTAFVDPLVARLDRLGERGFARLLAADPDRAGEAGLLLDMAQAVLQRAEGYQARPTAAFEEVVSDVYAGFLSAESRRGVKPPEAGVLPPLVRWGSAESGPYTWTARETARLGAGAAVVSLPDANATSGLLAWAALAHETAGHDLLEADRGLQPELARAVRSGVTGAGLPAEVAGYWADRIDEAASDVLGVLNMGPAAAAGVIGYFRGLNGAWAGRPHLRNVGDADDPHPADIVRGYLVAETVRLLSFQGAGRWADRLTAEVDRDLGRVRLAGTPVSAEAAKASAAAVARAIVRTPMRALEGRALGDIQDWSDRDEAVVASLREELRGRSGGAPVAPAGAYAAHAVAAGVYEAVAGAAPPHGVMDRMVGMLAEMHRANPDWSSSARGGRAAAAVAL
ncbi:MAG: hypothetical protein U0229_14660 [Anaeromyxobacter sp.]